MQPDIGSRIGLPDRTGRRAPALPIVLTWLAFAALFVVALALRHLVAANTDVSWLITVAERVLDGQRLYVDVIETNPPMAVLVYAPGVMLARALHMPVEPVIDGLVFVAIAVSLGMTARILRHSSVLDDVSGRLLAILAFAILAILPTQAFGQREHIALIELFPALAVMAMRMKREMPPRWAIIVAGIGVGLALCFKPYFAIGVLFGIVAIVVLLRKPRLLWAPEHVIAAACVGLYVVVVALAYPEFFTAIGPLVRDVYLPVGLSLQQLLEKPAITIWAAGSVSALLLGRSRKYESVLVLLAMSFGFAVVFLVQRKGWPYHSLLMVALCLLALSYAVASEGFARQQLWLRGSTVAMLAVLFLASMAWFNVAFDARPLQAAVARLGPHPKILGITAEPGIGHPLTRAVGGTWVSRQQAIWVDAYLDYMKQHGQLDPPREAALEIYAKRECAMLVDDIRKNPPDIVLVDNLTADGRAWLSAHPDVADLLTAYHRVETINHIDILTKAR